MNLRSLSTGLSASLAGSLALVTATALLEPVQAGPVTVKPTVPQAAPQPVAPPRYVLVPIDQISADYPMPARGWQPAPLPPRVIAQLPAPTPAPAEPDPQQQPVAQAPSPEALARRCNAGRLIGGLAGGGIGYMASRKDGRSWAVPLGTLLGTQMGCPLAQGRGPLSLFGL
jgi:hypothetical protein